MDHTAIISQLQKNASSFAGQLLRLQEEEYLWKPAPEKWCLLEVVCHLLDEEKEDFRQRVQTTLESPGEAPPSFDPVAWVKDRDYISQNFNLKVAAFLDERAKSVAWLQGLEAPNWENAYVHNSLGPMRAELFLSNWLAHDWMHLRQILGLRFGYLQASTGHDLSYAGNW